MPKSCIPERIVPIPSVSRISAMIRSATRKPMPIPSPSSAESPTVFFLANISALPSTIQLTTIRASQSPRTVYTGKRYASRSIFTAVTNAAITTI